MRGFIDMGRRGQDPYRWARSKHRRGPLRRASNRPPPPRPHARGSVSGASCFRAASHEESSAEARPEAVRQTAGQEPCEGLEFPRGQSSTGMEPRAARDYRLGSLSQVGASMGSAVGEEEVGEEGGGGGGGGEGWGGGGKDRGTGGRSGHGSKASHSGSGGLWADPRSGSARRASPSIRCTTSSQPTVRRGLGMEQYTDPWNDFPSKVDAPAAGGSDDLEFGMSNEPWSAHRTFFAAAARVRSARRSALKASRRNDMMNGIGWDSQGAGPSQSSAAGLSLAPVLGVGRRNDGHERLERPLMDSPPSPATCGIVPAHGSEYRSGSAGNENAGGSGIYKGHVSDGGTEGTLEKSTAQAEASSPWTPAAVSTSCQSFGGIHHQSNHPQRTAEDRECSLDGECRSYGGTSLSTRSPTMLGSPRNTISGHDMDTADDKDDVQHGVQDRNADLTVTPPRSARGFMGSSGTSKTEVAYYQPPVSEGYTGDGDEGASTDSGLSWPSTPGIENDGGSECFRGSASDGGKEEASKESTAGVEASAPSSPASSISYKSIVGGIRHQSNRRAGNGKRHLDEEGGIYGSGGLAARPRTMFGSLRSIIAGNGMDITDDEEGEQEDDEPSYHGDLIDPAPTFERRFTESPVTSNNIPAPARAYSPGSPGNENDGGSGTTSGDFYTFEHASRPSTTSAPSYSRSGDGGQQDYDAAQLQSMRPCARRAPPDAVQNDSPPPGAKEGTVSSYGPPKPGDVTSGGSIGIGACWWGEKVQPTARANISPVVEVPSTSTSRSKRSWDDAGLRGIEVSGSSATSCGGSSANSGTAPADGAPDSGTVEQSPNDGLPPSKRLRVYLDDYDLVQSGGAPEAWEESAAGVGGSVPAEVSNNAGRRAGDREGFPDGEVGRLATRMPATFMSLRDIIAGHFTEKKDIDDDIDDDSDDDDL
ncbi:hypothetical protein Esi_0040_0073 [Ectocarpus siliculosus]|uniref:Uncharacterized protein n=1 Tax=Ectocarpus siliculosus TaxID=2880 RepID=D7G0D2_ECTSI|nr:hypothetical protein Esi_0040_0073 [Ectocarpus siliculosus]|eukprot:CBJ26659.1 hypothetical protein Esi_0040_0073 [Ectocarpus siliculosus]